MALRVKKANFQKRIMTAKDIFTYPAQLAFNVMELYCSSPSSGIYQMNYEHKDGRRIMLPRDLIEEAGMEPYSTAASKVFNAAMKTFLVRGGEMDFVSVKGMDSMLGKETISEAGKTFRKEGGEYFTKVENIMADDFKRAYRLMMLICDIAMGARYRDSVEPREGFAIYTYERFYMENAGRDGAKKRYYPFEHDSPSEKAFISFQQGFASGVHSMDGTERAMEAEITHNENKAIVLSSEKQKSRMHRKA